MLTLKGGTRRRSKPRARPPNRECAHYFLTLGREWTRPTVANEEARGSPSGTLSQRRVGQCAAGTQGVGEVADNGLVRRVRRSGIGRRDMHEDRDERRPRTSAPRSMEVLDFGRSLRTRSKWLTLS
jgi:hypothetical protein